MFLSISSNIFLNNALFAIFQIPFAFRAFLLNIYISSFPICLPANVDGVLHTNVKFFSLSGLWPSNAKHFFVAFPGERKSHRRTLSGQGLANVTDGGLIMVNAPAPFCLGSGSTAVAITHPVVQILPVTESVQSCIQTQFSLPLFKV